MIEANITTKVKKARGVMDEIGFVNQNGTLVIQNGDNILILGGIHGNYMINDPEGKWYAFYRLDAVDVLFSGDSVELKLE